MKPEFKEAIARIKEPFTSSKPIDKSYLEWRQSVRIMLNEFNRLTKENALLQQEIERLKK